MPSIIVTGANGFVGSHILEALASQPVQIIAACRDPSKLPPWFSGETLAGDLRDPTYIKRIAEAADVICHAASWTSLWNHARASHDLFLEPSLQLVRAAAKAGVARFVFISTTSAAAPQTSHDPLSRGIPRRFWPHLCNVIAIENAMRDYASQTTMVSLRCGIFAGERYGLGVLPILLPRLKTHLVPWMNHGRTSLPIVDGSDIGQAFARAALEPTLSGYTAFNIVGPEVPSTREVIQFIHDEFGYPQPHFSVPFPIAYAFAWLMEKLDPIVPWEPLVTRSIVHLLEEVNASNEEARKRLGYQPQVHWKTAIRKQVAEMKLRQKTGMKMFRPLPDA